MCGIWSRRRDLNPGPPPFRPREDTRAALYQLSYGGIRSTICSVGLFFSLADMVLLAPIVLLARL